jgi:hypothetical protein
MTGHHTTLCHSSVRGLCPTILYPSLVFQCTQIFHCKLLGKGPSLGGGGRVIPCRGKYWSGLLREFSLLFISFIHILYLCKLTRSLFQPGIKKINRFRHLRIRKTQIKTYQPRPLKFQHLQGEWGNS